MHLTLTPIQIQLLRRCSGGLRVWEVGDERAALLAQLATLCHLRLVSYDEGTGYEATPAGESWLARFAD